MEISLPGLSQFKEAAARISPLVHRTPLITCTSINTICKAALFFKCENLQKVGAFKARGAVNAVFSLPEEVACMGVATHSSGNHAAALAYAARCRGIKAYVVMPENAPAVKKTAVASYGAEIVFCEPTLKAREETIDKIVRQTGSTFIHPYNDYRVIAGQGTAALELLNQVENLDAIIAPVGGGGLLSGTALAVRLSAGADRVYGAEPAGADDAYRSLKENRIVPMENPNTIADGLRTSLGTLTFPIIKKNVNAIITVSDDSIIEAMRLIWERAKLVVEPSGAVPLAALLEKRSSIEGDRIGLILSGGNVDLKRLPF